jgi:hypothetical protein
MLSANGEDIHLFPWLTYILDKPKLRSAGEIFWSLTISAEDLEKFLAGKGPLLRGTKATIDDERITLSRGHGLAGALFDIREPLSLAGKLEVRPDSNIHLDLHQLKAFGISPGRVLVQPMLALINPIVRSADLNRMLKKISIDMLEGFTLHNRFREIKLSTGFAEIHSEMFALKRKPEDGANGNRVGQNGD